MKKIFLTTLVLTLPVAAFSMNDESADKAALAEEGKKIFMSFGETLKGHLKSGLESGGPAKALEVCHKIAPSVAEDLSNKHNVKLSRTSLKLRNPDNAPDAWEKNVLMNFEKRKAAGEDVKKIAYSEIVTENGQRYFRMMKAIPTAEKPCLACHGTNIKAEIAETINSLYPGDQATGFKAGDIRGAFTLKKTL